MLLNHSVKRFFSDFFFLRCRCSIFKRLEFVVSFLALFFGISLIPYKKRWSYTRETQFLVFVIARLKKTHGFGQKKNVFLFYFRLFLRKRASLFPHERNFTDFFRTRRHRFKAYPENFTWFRLKLKIAKRSHTHVRTFSMEIAQCEFDCDSIIT